MSLRLILASASPRRLALLEQIGVKPDEVVAPNADETPKKDELPRELAERLAILKAEAARTEGAIALGADTVVACGRRILPKAEKEEEARACLELLSGRAHRVMTGVAIARPERATLLRLVETRVIFKRLTAQEIDSYLKSGEWEGKAGGYAVQGRAGRFVKSINGSFSAVVGLPLLETANLLEGAGYRLG